MTGEALEFSFSASCLMRFRNHGRMDQARHIWLCLNKVFEIVESSLLIFESSITLITFIFPEHLGN